MAELEAYGDIAGFRIFSSNWVATSQRGYDAMSSIVVQQYTSRMDALSPQERMARCTAMLKWTWDLLARQIIAELGTTSDERLKWEVARRMYGSDPAARAIIDQRLEYVSR